jgi:periplasmic protein TonB
MRLKIGVKWMVLLLIGFFQSFCFANEIKNLDTPIYTFQTDSLAETPPAFKGGPIKMYKFINKNFVYPEAAQKAKTQGKVMLKILVESDGDIGKISVLKGIGNGCDEEAVRIIRAMPAWIPAMRNGKPLASYYTLPIVFKLKK